MEVCKEQSDAPTTPLKQLEEEPADNAWISNDLVLDSICKFLPAEDLQNIRLVASQLNRAAARVLAKKTVVYLTSETLAGQEVSIVNGNTRFAYGGMQNCKCMSDSGKRRYFSVDHESFPREPIRDNHFRPRRVSILGCAVAYRLSCEQFSNVEELEITRYNQSSGVKLLQNVAILFPNLKSLTFRQIQPHCWIKDTKCRCSFCMRFMLENVKPGPRKNRPPDEDRYINRDEDESTGTSEPYDAGPLSVEQINCASKLPLRKLSFEVSPHSTEHDWEILKYFPKLEVLEINSFQDWWVGEWSYYSRAGDGIFYRCTVSYVDCLRTIFPYIPTSTLGHVSFRVGPGDSVVFQKLLNQLHPHTVSLDIYGIGPKVLLPGLEKHIMEALETLIIQARYAWEYLHPLTTTRFFCKSRWTLVFQGDINVWSRLQKTEETFMLQEKGCYEPVYDIVSDTLDILMRVHQQNPPEYNYGFHRYGATNGFEILRPHLMFSQNLLHANWMRMENFICGQCRDIPRLLCDLPGFREEANIKFADEPPCETQHYNRAWTFCTVPHDVLTKWTQQLDLEIAAAKSKRPCSCRCWDAVTKFGRPFPSSIPNPEEPEPELRFSWWTDPAMEPYCYSYSRITNKDLFFVS